MQVLKVFFSSTSHLHPCSPPRWRGKDFFLPPMHRPGAEPMSVQLHLFWGTLIQDALPTEPWQVLKANYPSLVRVPTVQVSGAENEASLAQMF